MNSLALALTKVEQSAIGMIGGADGPTAVLVSGKGGAVLLWLAGVALAAYLLGSVNFGILISKWIYRDDVRRHGSGNAGSTNILRTYGKKAAIATLLGDMGKGVLAVLLGRVLCGAMVGIPEAALYGGYVAAIFAVLGHLWPIWFGFKGGKGVAVAAGAILASSPMVFLMLVVLFLVLVFTTRIVSLASIACAGGYPILTMLYCWWKGENVLFAGICTLIMGGLVIWMHRSNIKRLLNGTEYKFGQDKKK